MGNVGAGFGSDDKFSIRYPSGGWERSSVASIEDVSPSGADMTVKASFAGRGRKPSRLMASRMVEVINLQTCEVIEDPVSWFRLAWLERVAGPDGKIPLDVAIDALPVASLGPERSRRLAEAFDGSADFAATVRQAGHERSELGVRVARQEIMDHIAFLKRGGPDLISDRVLSEGWPIPEDIPGLWRLVTIDGVGPKSIDALLDAFDNPQCRRAIEDIARYSGGQSGAAPTVAAAVAPPVAAREHRAPPTRQAPIRPSPAVRRPTVGTLRERRAWRWWPLSLIAVAVAGVVLLAALAVAP